MNRDIKNIIVFQGEFGSNSHLVCRDLYPEMEYRPCATFSVALEALQKEEVKFAILPIENNQVGRVADVHRLLPQTGYFITGEYFMKIEHSLLALPSSSLENITHVYSHEMALRQCREAIHKGGIIPVVTADTAGSAREIAEEKNPTKASIATEFAAEIHGLKVLKKNFEGDLLNLTRFLVISKTPDDADFSNTLVITSIVFKVRNIPAALYKVLGAFAVHHVNMVKLESCQVANDFKTTEFWADIEGHPESDSVRLALEEMTFFCSEVNIMGVYKADKIRYSKD